MCRADDRALSEDDAQLQHMVEFVLRVLPIFQSLSSESARCRVTLGTDMMRDIVNNWGVGVGGSDELGKAG